MDLQLDRLTVTLGGTALLHALSLDVPDGQVVGLLGPNGSGKSTALRCAYRALRPSGGTVRVGGDDLATLGRRHSAQTIAALTQEGGIEFDFTVAGIVALGRTPHLPANRSLSAREWDLCRAAMAQLRIEHLAQRRGVQDLLWKW